MKKIPLKSVTTGGTRRVTVSVTREIRARMLKHPEVNWSAVVRNAFETVLNMLDKK